MPDPHLLPHAADLVKLGYVALVAALTCGMGVLVGARRLDTAFFAGWGLGCLIFVVTGTWLRADLRVAAAVSGLLGAMGLIRQARRLASQRTEGDFLGLRVLLIGTPFILLVLGMVDIAWDDFAFWVPNLLHLCATWHFPTLAQPAGYSAMAAYPYGVALSGFAVHLLGGEQVDTVAFIWNLLAMLAACAACANVVTRRIRTAGRTLTTGAPWSVAALATLVVGMGNPAFIAKNLLTNMGDSATGAGLALLCALLFEWRSVPSRTSERINILTEISLTCCAVVFIRQANPALLALLFISAAGGLMLFQGRVALVAVFKLFAALILPVFVWYSWIRYADAEIPQGRHYLLAWHAWHWSVFGSTLASALHVFLVKTGFTVMAIGIGCVEAHLVLRRLRIGDVARMDRGRVASAITVTAVAGLTFGNIAFLLFCYLATSFGLDEAKQAITFWRFLSQTGEALVIGFACIVPVQWLTPWLGQTLVQRLLPPLVLLMPVVAVATYRDDLSSPVPRLRNIADALNRTLPAGQPLILADLSGNGFAPLVVKYQMTAIDNDQRPLSVVADPHGIPRAEVLGLHFPTNSHVWLAEGSPAFGDVFGGATNVGCSYLFSADANGLDKIRSWDIGPYRWTRQTTAGHSEPGPGCSG